MRTSALERPDAPLASAPCSQSTTRVPPRAASAQAMLAPLTPPPMMTTSAVSVMPVLLGACAPGSRARAHVAGVQRVAQPVAEEIEARHRQRDHQARKDRDPRRRGEVALGIVQHVAPARQRRLDAIAEIADIGLQ